MTQETRQELLQVLGELSEECPEVRLGQLIANLATLAKGPTYERINTIVQDLAEREEADLSLEVSVHEF